VSLTGFSSRIWRTYASALSLTSFSVQKFSIVKVLTTTLGVEKVCFKVVVKLNKAHGQRVGFSK
jgi:hypothetical protein